MEIAADAERLFEKTSLVHTTGTSCLTYTKLKKRSIGFYIVLRELFLVPTNWWYHLRDHLLHRFR